MSKRDFRSSQRPEPARAQYPTQDEFELGRRDMLRRLGLLGAALLGAGALAGCADRAVGADPDAGPPEPPVAGGAPVPDARIDEQPPTAPDGSGGVPDLPPAPADEGPPAEPDLGEVTGGVAPQPDAGIDKGKGN